MHIIHVTCGDDEHTFRTNDSGEYLFTGTSVNNQISCDAGFNSLKRIKRAIRGSERWVVQEYVEIPSTRVPVIKKGRVRLVTKKVNLNPFVFNGRYAGSMARLTDDSIINVSAGGGLVPAMMYKAKK